MTAQPADGDAHLSVTCARGGWTAPSIVPPSAPPIYMTTAFDFESLEQIEEVATGRAPGYIYTRDGNPNHDAFASDVAALEGAEAGVATASGMGALAAALLGLLESGDRVISAKVLYGRTGQLLKQLQKSFGIHVEFVDANQPDEFATAAQGGAKLAIIEGVTNPLLEVIDVPAVAQALGSIPLLVDNTFATPCLMRPIEHGAELVWHSASKYLNGHGDVMLGVLVGRKERIRKVRATMALFGFNANPFECWLASRGLRTLPLRMERVSDTATELAGRFQQHRSVKRAFYPALADHPSHHLAERLLPHGCGGMLAIDIGSRHAVDRLFRRLAGRIPFSPTLADARTTLSYPVGTSHKFMTGLERAAAGITDGLVRVSVGLEDVESLWREFDDALKA